MKYDQLSERAIVDVCEARHYKLQKYMKNRAFTSR